MIFDIDDTLYPTSCGFSDHRNGQVITDFMRDVLGFASAEEAMALRNEVFRAHHSTLKGLAIASSQGRLPRPFEKQALGEYWAEHCDFARFLGPLRSASPLAADLHSLRHDAGMRLVVFTNAPRKYGLRCLAELGLRDLIPDSLVFAVEDVMPACKPEPAAFKAVLQAVGASPERCAMFEDSMKNIQTCHALGIRTVLIDETAGGASAGEAALLGDTARPADSSVDLTMQHIGQLRERMPFLWDKPGKQM